MKKRQDKEIEKVFAGDREVRDYWRRFIEY